MLTYQELLAQRAGLAPRNRQKANPTTDIPTTDIIKERRMDAVGRRLARNPALAARVSEAAPHGTDEAPTRP